MKLKTVKIHPVNESFVVYIPIEWIRAENLKKGSKVSWHIEENDHKNLVLKAGE